MEPPIGHTEAVRAYFRRAFQGKDPYPFQLEIIDRLLAGENVVALAPTGAGKTLAPIAAFAYAREHGLQFADRLLYALPQRTLAMALSRSVAEDLKTAAPNLRVTVQTGNVPDDPYFEGDVVFTTIDQLLGAYIEVPVSLPDRLANVPAGALLGALIVFDEFHLLEPGRALATALDVARQLKPHSHTLMMSATFPRPALSRVVLQAGAQLVEVKPEEIESIPSQRDKRRTYLWHPEPLTADAVLSSHTGRTIVVVNRVARAQQLYGEVKEEAARRFPSVQLILLHSRFLQIDRQILEKEVIEYFKQGGRGGAILIATSVVEVGLDISCDVLHTEVPTAAALFQRAGRCARYKGEAGTVHVYDLERSEKGGRRYGPYQEDRDIVDAVAEQIGKRSGDALGFAMEREVVDVTHREVELTRLGEVLGRRRGQVMEAQVSHEPSWVRRLIRDSDSVNILIHHDPAALDLARRPETFSLPRIVLRGILSHLELSGGDAGKVAYPVFPEESDEGYNRRPVWEKVEKPVDAERHFVLALHPTLASYDSEYGLRLLPGEPGGYESHPTRVEADLRIRRASYRKEYYAEHAGRVLREMDALLQISRVATHGFATELRIGVEDVARLARFAAAAHDLGKLSTGVQDAMWRWMEEVHRHRRDGFLAHTSFDSDDPEQLAFARQACFHRPPHAIEGAYAAWPALIALLRKMQADAALDLGADRAIFSAVARHHNPRTSKLHPFELATGAREEALSVLSERGTGSTLSEKPTAVDCVRAAELPVQPGPSPEAYRLYLFLVRLLRIADQRATAGKE